MCRDFDHGDRVRIVYDDGYGWDGTVLTTENIGFGPALRVKRESDGEQLHVHCDRDVTVERRS
jgi:hypothetical protein